MTATQLFDALSNQLFQALPGIKASAIVDKDGLIIHSKLQEANVEDNAIGTVTAGFDSFIGRMKQDFGEVKKFVNIINTDENKLIFVSAGDKAIFTVMTQNAVSDTKLKVFCEHIASKIEAVLKGEEVDPSIPLIVSTMANLDQGKFPTGDFSLKAIVVGEPMVGKTSLIHRFVDNSFAESYLSTIGVDISSKKITITDECKVTLACWDIGGQITNMSPYRKRFYQGADFACITFDISRRKTFEQIDHWLQDISTGVDRNVIKALIATKMDLPDHEVSIEEIEAKAESMGCPYILTSSLTGSNVIDVFRYAAFKFIERI